MKKRRRRRNFFVSFSHTNWQTTFFHKTSFSFFSVFEKILLVMSGGCPPTEETRKEERKQINADDDDDADDDKGVSTCEFRVACVQFEPAHGAFNFYRAKISQLTVFDLTI